MADVLGGLWGLQHRGVLLRHIPLLVPLLLRRQGIWSGKRGRQPFL